MSNSLYSAIDNHNVANGDESWFTATGDFITKAPTSAVVAGVTSIANSGIAVANFFGAEAEMLSSRNILKSLDDDLAKYYDKHSEGIEIGGFILGAFIPGTAGVKALQLAKAGVMGTNMAKSSGLMKSLTADYATAAKIEFASGTSPFTLLNQNVVKSLSQGFGSAALEAAAFEVAVTATMFKSPVLDDMSAKDLAWNMATGVIIGGGIGGVLSGVSSVYGIKKAREAIKGELLPWRVQELDETASSDLKLLNYFQQKLTMPKPSGEEIFETLGTKEATIKLINSTRDQSVETLDTLIRQEFTKLSSGDKVLGEQLFKKFSTATNFDEILPSLLNTKGIQRITANEKLVVGDVLFPTHGVTKTQFDDILARGAKDELLVTTASENTQGFRVVGDVSQLRVTGAGAASEKRMSQQEAFNNGFDLYRNLNNTFTVNPESTILQAINSRRTPNNLIIDFEKNGAIVDKATPGLADLATSNRPIEVRGDIVMAGNLRPMQVSGKFDPLDKDYLKVQARYIWAQEQKNIKWQDKIVDENDLPLLERAYFDGPAAQGLIIRMNDGKKSRAQVGEGLRRFIEDKKIEFAQKLNGKSIDEIQLRLNVPEEFLLGGKSDVAKLQPGMDYQIPRYARADYDDGVNAMAAYDAAKIDGAVQYEQAKSVVVQRHIQTFNNFSREMADQFPDSPNFNDPGRAPTGGTAGATLFGFANANYGSIQGFMQYVGTLTNRLKIRNTTETVRLLNNTAAAIDSPQLRSELDLVTNKLRSSADAYVFHPADPNKLILKKDFTVVQKGGSPSTEITLTDQVSEFLKVHASRNGNRQVHVRNLKGNAGLMDDTDLDVVYPPPIDTKKYNFFAFVEPRSMTLGDRKRVIVAKDAETLEKLIGQIDPQEFTVTTKAAGERFHKAVGDYDYALGLNESVVDSSLKRKGVLSDHFAGNPSDKILDEYLAWHTKQEEVLVTRMVEHRYSQAFLELQHLGNAYTDVATSRYRSITEALTQTVKDPYNDLIKTALDISKASEYKWWKSFNEVVRETIEAPAQKLGAIFQKTEKVDDAFLAEVNRASAELGLGTPFQTAAMELIQGNIAAKPFLGKWIAKAQALMSTTLLQLDFFNAINNTISTPILLSAETNHLISAIRAGNPLVAGKLSQLLSVATPEGAAALSIPTTGKLLRNALQNYRRDQVENIGLLTRYQKLGAVTDVLQQERQMLGDLTVDFGKITIGDAESRLARAVESGRKITGNRLAEEMTRFVSADVMRQITDLALESGILRTAKEADEYIQLFVNRVQGNYLHSQRPIVFQGVVGQAISLFQTYQFNLIQQMLKYVGEGDKKSVAILLGLQGSIYGMQGLPAYNFLNTHIVGNAAGNTQHRDLHYATNSVFGKQLGDWILYGAGSNALGLIDPALKINIYTRGDINPRQVTVLPTNIEDIPVVSASVRFVRNLATAASRIGADAAVWPTISQAIEHNGLSRPLAGLAQVVQGYTTTNQGSLLSSSQDFWSIAQVARIAGGKPFDEAVALDALYRINAYRAADMSKIQNVGAAMKTSFIKGREPGEQEITDFAANYAKAGGRIENFNKFMAGQMLGANRSQVNKAAEALNGPFAKQMQVIMGGVPIPDYMNQP